MTTVTTTPELDYDFDPFDAASNPTRLADAIGYLNGLSKFRADDYEQRLNVGKSLFSLGQDGLYLWDQWCKQSQSYVPGWCAEKWQAFTKEVITAEGITLANLFEWMREDGNKPSIRPCPPKAKPSHYKLALSAYGCKPALNEMNDEVFINGTRLTDPLEARILNALREQGYTKENIIEDCILEMALDNQFHPIRDYLTSLKWDGKDYISELAAFFQDKDDIFPVLLRKWLIGAVGRILKPLAAIQNPVLVLDGPQGLGKSRFTYWLGSPLPAYYLQSAISTGDKDSLIRLCSTFVWELSELGATFRRSDLESLKAFITTPMVTVRAPYGKRDMHKPPTASFVGTINNVAGFLSDPTGNRRYRPCTLVSINWDYDKQINVNNVWAQAVALFLNGEGTELDNTTQDKIRKISEAYEVDDPISFSIFNAFKIDPNNPNFTTTTAEIIKELRTRGDITGGDDKSLSMRIANVLVKAGCENTRVRVNNRQVRAWKGVGK